jgi:hypothetical protein
MKTPQAICTYTGGALLQSGYDFKPWFTPDGDENDFGCTWAAGELDAPDRMAAGSTALQYSRFRDSPFIVSTVFWRE